MNECTKITVANNDEDKDHTSFFSYAVKFYSFYKFTLSYKHTSAKLRDGETLNTYLLGISKGK